MNMMDNQKNSIKSAILAEVILGGCLIILIAMFPKWIYICFFIMTAGSIAILLFFQYKIKKQINDTMTQVNDTILSLIDGQPIENFDENEDSLLGKFQMQILKLYKILQSFKDREKVLRKQISKNISNLTHQINTPITNIQMYSSFLNQEELSNEEQKVFIDNINLQAEKLSWLGESFSKISRLETGIIILHPAENELLSAILPAINQAALKAQEHGNEIILKGKQSLTAYFDKKWTEEVFFNLLDNAVKYSDRGSKITIEMIPYDLYVRINIKSTGIKISKEEHTKIFHRFYRGENVISQEGVGLGLYLVRKILEEEKAYIKVETRITKSTLADGEVVFSVFLLKEEN